VRLTPKNPPGRVNRKARAFEPEIGRLRSEGYTCEAIRAALADVGVDVSLSTVQREAAKSKGRSLVAARGTRLVSTADVLAATASSTCASAGLAGDPRTGKEIAEAFVGKRYTNPLLRDRNNHENCRH
jgi:hypothetical protein